MVFLSRWTQKAAAEQGSQTQSNETRNQDRETNSYGELTKAAPDYSTHKEHWDENSRQRERHREDGETDFFGAVHGGFKHPFSLFHASNNVLQHHDGVIHHKTYRKRQGHHGEVIQAVAEKIHEGECA